MEFFIQKIFEGKGEGDNLVHMQFLKFSRGEFRNKAMLVVKNRKGKYSIGTTADYANELVRYLAEKLGTESTTVTGIVVSTSDLKGELDFVDISQFQGIKKYKINKEITGEEIIRLCDKLEKSFFGLSFKVGDTELKIKEKLPKSGKPSKKSDDKLNADFCKIKTTDEELVKSLIFDSEAEDFNDASVQHTYLIESVAIPTDEELTEKGIDKNDFAKIREFAKKKGKIIRELKVDGKEFKKEIEFIA